MNRAAKMRSTIVGIRLINIGVMLDQLIGMGIVRDN